MCWHKWEKWEIRLAKVYTENFKDKEGNYIEGDKTYQQRRCKKCGKYQLEEM